MSRPSSQNAGTRHPYSHGIRTRRSVATVAGAVTFLGAAWLAIDCLAGSELGRTIDAYLTRLADPRSWIP